MNIETAKRLFKYRKANAYSQEELADKIGVSRQAVSKWERGESSPDTDNLIALARLYGISIDELINGADEPEAVHTDVDENTDDSTDNGNEDDSSGDDEQSKTHVSFKNGIHVHDGNNSVDIDFTGIHVESEKGESVHIGSPHNPHIHVRGIDDKYIDRHHNVLHAVLCAGVLTAYLIIGFTLERGWAVGWLIIFIIPVFDSIIKAVKLKNPVVFAYPVLVIGSYLSVGMLKGIWHPTWIMFLTIPIYYAIASLFNKDGKNAKSEQNNTSDE